MLPNGWKSYCLGNVFKLTSGKSRPKKYLSPKATGNEIPVFGGNGITGYTSDFLIENQTIVIGRVGEYCGCVRLSSGQVWITDNALYICEIYLEQDLLFLSYLLKFANLEKLRNETGQPLISQKPIYDLVLAFPPLHEQKKIAAILSSVDEAIASTQAVIDQTRKVKQGLLQQLLTRGIGHTRFKESALGEIPEEWEVVPYEKVSKRLTYGFTNPMPTTEEGPWMVTATNIFNGRIDYRDTRHTSQEAFDTLLTDKSRPQIGDVLITKDGTLGRVARVDRENICVNQSVAVIQPDNNFISSDFLFWSLQSPQIQKKILDDAGGSTIKHIYITKLAKTLVPIPFKAEQELIVNRIQCVQDVLDSMEAQLESTKRIKQGLMQDLLTGRVRVGCTP